MFICDCGITYNISAIIKTITHLDYVKHLLFWSILSNYTQTDKEITLES